MATKVGEDNTLGSEGKKKIGDEYVGISVEDRLQSTNCTAKYWRRAGSRSIKSWGVAINLIGNAGYTAFITGQINNKTTRVGKAFSQKQVLQGHLQLLLH